MPSDGTRYARIVDLGALEAASYATGINAHGDVVGYEKSNASYYLIPEPDAHAFYWSAENGKTYLADWSKYSYFSGITDSGLVTGTVDGSVVLYNSSSPAGPIALSPPGRSFGINAHGVATGGQYFPDHQSMFRWDGQSLEELPLDPQLGGWSVGYAIDSDGTVVGDQGNYTSNGEVAEAIRYKDGRGTEALNHFLPTTEWLLQSARSVKDGITIGSRVRDVIVGSGFRDGQYHHAYELVLTPAGTFDRIVDLGVPEDLSADAPNMVQANQVNASGEIAGTVYDAGAATWPVDAFVYANGRNISLNQLIDPNSGWTLVAAFGINDNHEVVGYGFKGNAVRAFKLILPSMPADPCAGLPDGADCISGDPCAEHGTCDNHVCQPGPPITCATDACHPTATCEPTTGACSAPYVQSAACPYVHVDFIEPPEGDNESIPSDINDQGRLIGWSDDQASPYGRGSLSTGFYADAGDLEPLTAPAGWTVFDPTAINTNGFIVAEGGPGTTDWEHAVIIKPDQTSVELPVRLRFQATAFTNRINGDGLPTVVGGVALNDAGAVGIWHLDGNTSNSSTYEIEPMTFPAPANPTYVVGHSGQALQFDGTTSLVVPEGDSGVSVGFGLSVSAWVKPTGACPATDATILSRASDWSFGLTCGTGGATSLIGSISLNYLPTTFGPVGSLNVGQWNHVVMSWNEEYVRFYVNGLLVHEQHAGGTLSGYTSEMVMGANLVGALDEVALYATPLAPVEVQHLFEDDTAGVYQRYNGYPLFVYQNGEGQVIAPPAGTSHTVYMTVSSINEGGEVVGMWIQADNNYDTRAFIYDDINGMRDLNTLLPANSGWTLTRALHINNGRQVVGEGEHSGSHRMYRFDLASGTIKDLGILPSQTDPSLYRLAKDVNDHGNVVGGSFDQWPFWAMRGFVYTDSLGLTDLNSMIDPGTGWELRDAVAINNNDVIVGQAYNPSRNIFGTFRMQLGGDALGECASAQSQGTSCKPSDLCATAGTCQNGTCVATAELNCPAADQCHTANGCQTTTGTCSYTPIAGATSCPAGTVTPVFLGLATVGGATKAVFDYTTDQQLLTIPYGPQNTLSDASGPIQSPSHAPPTTFVSGPHAPFVADLTGGYLIWTVDGSSVTALASSTLPGLTVTPLADGTHEVTLGDGRKLNLDATPPPDPTASRDLEKPPIGAAFNGVLAGQFSVSPSGAATYTVPISVPPGIAGMAPKLALAYNSQGTDGIAGQGWSLSGLSMITRCPRTRQQDGYGRPVMLDALDPAQNTDHHSDGLCLDGGKLLETSPGSGSYVTEKTDFSTITLDSTGAFQVVTKGGETRYYGRLNADRVAGVQTAVWLLDRVVDAWGNFMDIEYNGGVGNGSPSAPSSFAASGVWVSKLNYTGSLTDPACQAAVPDPSCTFASVSFAYECRPDIRWTRFKSLRIPQSQRLKTITTPQGSYSLTYKDSMPALQGSACAVGMGPSATGVSTLQQVDYCAGSMCLQPLKFEWQSRGASDWVSKPGYTIPDIVDSSKGLKGMQFVDIDNDGRPDLIVGRTNGPGGDTQRLTAQNTGSGWDLNKFNKPNQKFPLSLSDQHDLPTNVRFADLDGDGRLDLIVESANVTCDSQNVCVSCPVNQACTTPSTPHSPAVWLNRFTPDGGDGGWEFNTSFEPQSFSLSGDNRSFLGDFDGDGKADLVHISWNTDADTGATTTTVRVTLNRYPHGWKTSSFDIPGVAFSGEDSHLSIADVNRDGLADLIHEEFYYYSDPKTSASSETVFLNQGPGPAGADSVAWSLFTRTAPSGGTSIDTTTRPPRLADVDGDGFYDMVDYESITNAPWVFESIGFGDGTGYGIQRGVGNGLSYVDVLDKFTPPLQGAGLGDPNFGYTLADIDGDGLVDLVRNHVASGDLAGPRPWSGGEILLNTGTTWISVAGHSGWETDAGDWRIPFQVPNEIYTASALIDLDGDGMPDAIQQQSAYSLPAGAYLNPYQRPSIYRFPNGLAAATEVTYVSTAADAETYKNDVSTELSTKLLTSPVTVVSKVHAEDGSGTGTMADTTYTYHSLRQDSYGRGPLGFRQIDALDEASKMRTVTTYAQAYPYTGLPVRVDKFQGVDHEGVRTFYQLSRTETNYCNTAAASPSPPFGCGAVSGQAFPPGSKVFVFPSLIRDTAYLQPLASDPSQYTTTTESSFTFDEGGNSKFTTTTVTKSDPDGEELYSKTVENRYEHPEEEKEGKPTRVITTATGGTMNTVHTTAFEYAGVDTFGGVGPRLALVKKRVEPDAVWPIRVDTAYWYDQFGNIVTTTTCANGFDNCVADRTAADPATAEDPVHHPPFRTTTVSYDPSVLGVPVSYKLGRFPTRTINALQQPETTVYDPVLGAVLSKTGPNGIQTCYHYDSLGRQTSQVDRCNSDTPLTTTVQSFLTVPTICFDPPCGATGFSPPNSRVATVTTAPTGIPSWSYADDQGKSTGSLVYAFDGGFIETATAYNALGQIAQVLKPLHLANLTTDPGSPAYTQTIYDDFHRVWQVTDDLGVIDDTGTPKATTSVTTYVGLVAKTERSVRGNTETRTETKNGLGKVAQVVNQTEANKSASISYSYDADGNLTDTYDGANNHVHIGYDSRGRKTSTMDPDMGSWTYVVDGFGDLVMQTDALHPASTMTYDALGRMATKDDGTEAGAARWMYDTGSGAGIGKLAFMISALDDRFASTCAVPNGAEINMEKRAVKSFHYTAFGDVLETDECADGLSFSTSYQYDVLGRQTAIWYPVVDNSQLVVGYHYTALGHLHYLTDDSTDQSVLWEARAMNALGQVTDEQMRNGVETWSTRNEVTGWLLGSTAKAHRDGDTMIQNATYGFDEVGNLRGRTRSDAASGAPSSETFDYDWINRLLTATTTTGASAMQESYGYDASGNLTQKGPDGYTYGTGCNGPAGPHAVCTVGNGTPFAYDANGNLTHGGGRSVTYNTANKVTRVERTPDGAQSSSVESVDFMYGADDNRVVQLSNSGGVTARTVYVGLGGTGKSLYERTETGSGSTANVQHVHYIYAGGAHGGNACALRVLKAGGAPTATRFYSFDHLGSVTAMSDEIGRVSDPNATNPATAPTVLSYDPWGARRNPDGSAADPESLPLSVGHREFTGHEQIPGVGLVNMNGRLYDPSLGRFLSPDPHVQFVADLQSYNRYSYVSNNPLSYSDPTGYWAWRNVGKWAASTFGNPMNDFELVFGVAACGISGGAGCFAVGLWIAALNATVAIANGAGFEQTLLNTAIGLGVGLVTGGVAGSAGATGLASLIVGSASAALTTGIANVIGGQSFFGYDMLGAAFMSAAGAALSLAISPPVQVVQADDSAGDPSLNEDKRLRIRSGRTAKGPVALNVTDSDGNIVGTITVDQYEVVQKSGDEWGRVGVNIKMTASGVDGADWVQTVTRDGDTHVDPSPVAKDNDRPGMYYNSSERAEYSRGNDGLMFEDSPRKVEAGTWKAELSLVAPGADGHYQVLGTFSYGFSVKGTWDTLTATASPLIPTAPSAFHQQVVHAIGFVP